MNKLRLLFAIFISLMLCSTAFAGELNDVYKEWAKYSYVVVPGLRIYYPDSIKESIPRIVTSFSKVRDRLLTFFEKEKNYEATVVLNDHDDIVNSSAESDFDWISLSIIDEMDVLSARAYPLEKRFAISLARTYIKRSTSSSSNFWRRQLAMVAIPVWFMEGMALNYAFDIDSVQYSRLLDMARNRRLYSLRDLETLTSQPLYKKEEMLFQVQAMFAFWQSKYRSNADIDLMISIIRKPTGFTNAFKKNYGVTLNEAFNAFKAEMESLITDEHDSKFNDFIDVNYNGPKNIIFRAYNRISPDERIWVSSLNYTTENYDLFYRKGIQKPVILAKNVHPSLLYDKETKEIIIGKYQVNGHKQKRLMLVGVDLKGNKHIICGDKGSFKPLAIDDGRVYFVSSTGGITSIKSSNISGHKDTREELNLGSLIRPFNIALDIENKRVFYTFNGTNFITNLAVLPLNSKNVLEDSKVVITYDGDINSIKYFDKQLWCTCAAVNDTTQLFAFDEQNSRLLKVSNLPGGVWDISFSDPDKKIADVSTLDKGTYKLTPIRIDIEPIGAHEVKGDFSIKSVKLMDVTSNPYKTEYKSNLWSPVLGKDADGYVLGIYNYRSDRLGRTNIVVAPTFGLKSHRWGYTASFMKRFDLVKATLSFKDNTAEKDYMETEYYERVKNKTLELEYPLALNMTLTAGIDLAERSISKIEKSPRGLIPSSGKDHYYFVNLKQKSIRTEPYYEIFPRKGREVLFSYKKGSDNLCDGDFVYDSLSLKWDEYYPLNEKYVLTLSCYAAEDDKKNGIRRPDDLSLGSNKYMRAYDGSYKTGDKLRYASLALSRPFRFDLPRQIGWLRNEFSALSVFCEVGDVRNNGEFEMDYDRGVEILSKVLFLRRLPIVLRGGYAKQNGKNDHKTYFNFETDLSGFL